MPARYVSDTTVRCQTISQTRWVQRMVEDCDIVGVSWPPIFYIGNGSMTLIPSGPFYEISIPNPTSEVYATLETTAGLPHLVEVSGVTISGTGRIEVSEIVGGQV